MPVPEGIISTSAVWTQPVEEEVIPFERTDVEEEETEEEEIKENE